MVCTPFFSSPLSSLLVSLILHAYTITWDSCIGTSISVYGTITPTGAQPISNYTIDSGVPYQFAAQQLTKIQYQQLFFYATGLASGLLHTLVITNVANNGYLSLDYFQIESPDPGSSTSSSLNMPISSSSTRPSTTLTPSQTSSEPESTTTRPSTTSTTSLTPQISLIGAAIGGSVAASMIISLILFACFFARRRRRRKKNLPLPDSLSPPQLDMSHALAGRSSDITPFVIGDHLGVG
jgi:hypothetical protein